VGYWEVGRWLLILVVVVVVVVAVVAVGGSRVCKLKLHLMNLWHGKRN